MITRIELTPNGFFIAQAFTVGAFDEEIAAMESGVLPEERRAAIAEKMRQAAYLLHGQPPGGCC